MNLLNYKPHTNPEILESDYENIYLQSEVYHVSSLYLHEQIKNDFINLRTNIVDLNPAMITKCIQGTEQDFIMLMNKAKEFLKIIIIVEMQHKQYYWIFFRIVYLVIIF